MEYKLKIKALKDEAAKKIEEIEANKEKMIRELVQESREIKYQFDTTIQ